MSEFHFIKGTPILNIFYSLLPTNVTLATIHVSAYGLYILVRTLGQRSAPQFL
jgi:hypothetical protein